MQQWGTATEVTNTALNSQGSAMREQAEYSQSLEARLNRLSNAGTSLANIMGDAILTDGIVAVTESITRVADSASGLIETFGMLAPTMGLAMGTLTAFSPRLRTLARDIFTVTRGQREKAIATTGATIADARSITLSRQKTAAVRQQIVATNSLAAAKSRLKSVGAGLATSLGVGAVFLAVGFAVEKLTNYIGENISRKQRMREEYEKSIESFENERETIDNLVQSYKDLSEINRDNEQEQEYLNIQNELAAILPAIKVGEDHKGNAILANSEIMEGQIELLERQLELEREIALIEAPTNISEGRKDIDDVRDEISEQEHLLRQYQKMLENVGDGTGFVATRQRKHIADQIRDISAEIRELHDEEIELTQQVLESYGSIIQAQSELASNDVNWIANAYNEIEGTYISGQETSALDGMVEQVEKIREVFGESFELGDIDASSLYEVTEIADKISKYGRDWDEYRDSLVSVGVESDRANNIIGNLAVGKSDLTSAAERLGLEYSDNLIPQFNDAFEVTHFLTDAYSDNEEALDDLTGATDGNTDSKWENIDASEALYGVTSEEISQIENAIEIYYLLTDAEHLNQQQTEDLERAKEFLAQMFPHLVEGSELNVAQMRLEAEMINGMAKLSADYANGRLDSEDILTFESINASEDRIRQLQLELNQINEFRKIAHQQILDVQNMAREAGVFEMTYGEHIAVRNYRRILNEEKKLQTRIADVRSGQRATWSGSNLPALSGVRKPSRSSSRSSSGSNSRSGSRTEKSPEEIAWENAQKALEKYVRALADYDHKIQREQLLREQMVENSAEYNRSIDREIGLLRGQQKEINNYISAMNRVIRQDRISSDRKRELTEEIQKQQNEYLRLDNQIYNHVMTQRQRLADDSISLLQDAIRKRIRLLEGERDQEIKMLEERANAYTKYIDDKIDAMNREESEDEFKRRERELSDYQVELRRQINILDLNDSQEATARKRDLEEDLVNSIEELEELRRQRTLELRKQSLEDEKTRVQEELETQKSAIEEKFDEEIYYMEQLVENEQHFADLREEIMAGNLSNIQNMINSYIDDFKKYNEDAVREMDASWQGLINLMNRANNLNKDVRDATNSVVKSSSSGSSRGSSGGKTTSPSKSSSTPSTSNRSGGKSISIGNRARVSNSSAKAYMDSYGKQVLDWQRQAQAAGIRYNEPLYVVNRRADYAALSKTNNVGGAIAWVRERDLVGLKTGGFTGNNEGVAMLHKKELVLNQDDTSNFLHGINTLREIYRDPGIKSITNRAGDTNTDKSVHLNIEYYGGSSREEVNRFGTHMQNFLKRSGH